VLASLFTYMRKLSTRAMSETSELWPCLRAGESTSKSACKDERLHAESMEHPSFLERAMGIDQIRMNQAKALPRVPQFNWSQMESSYAKSHDSPIAGAKIGKPGMVRIDVEE
jgi:hypothetical protein